MIAAEVEREEKRSEVRSAACGFPTAIDAETQHGIEQYLFREAALLDDRNWEAWEKLFADDGMYWVPLAHDQADPFNHASLFYEDAMMREVRRRRLVNDRAWSQQPVTRTARTIGNVIVTGGSVADGKLIVQSSFHLTEWRARRTERHLAGRYTHSLVAADGAWKIEQKRVDLISCDGVQFAFEFFL